MTYPDSNQPVQGHVILCMFVVLPYLTVIHAVGSKNMEQVLLPGVVSLPEHDVVPVGSVHIQVYLSDVRAVQPCNFSGEKMTFYFVKS